MRRMLVVGILLVGCATKAEAALTLRIDTFTANQLTVTLDGFFDTATVGNSPGYLALKNDWSDNVGFHTELFNSLPVVALNTVKIGGVAVSPNVQNSIFTWNDTVFFLNPFGTESPIAAGTTVSGSLTLTGIGAFNPADASTLELVSGFNRPVNADDWGRFEARDASFATVATPEPASAAMFGLGALGMLGLRLRRKKADATVAA